MKAVYVLGAGSSVPANAPMTRDFQKVAAEVLKNMGDNLGTKKMAKALAFWNLSVPNANIEEFYILADLLQRLGVAKTEYPESALGLLDSVRYLIAKTLEVRMGTNISPVHREFFDKIRTTTTNINTIISLNWDIALDRAVMMAYGSRYIDYGFAGAQPLPGDLPLGDSPPSFRILKLHGSTNWWFCKKGPILWYAADKKAVIPYWEQEEPVRCPEEECPQKLVPLMVPPSSQKFESSEFVSVLSELWKEARIAIANCDQLAFVGYSFPPTDIQFRMLVHEALSRNDKLRTLAVVSNPKYGSKRVEFENHYSGMLTGARHHDRLTFRYFDFERLGQRRGHKVVRCGSSGVAS
jgi:hypothetical protein